MLVLQIIGLLVLAFGIYLLVVAVNRYTYKNYKYDFFNKQTFVTTAIGYAFLFFGNSWYREALEKQADILNGQILIGIGISLVIYVIYKNVKNTSLLLGLALTLFQLALYVVLSIIAVFALLVLMAIFSQTKPVYVINND